jgi:periplasmic protein TonB
MFNTLLASNLAPHPRLRSGLIALLLHIAIVLGAITATTTSRAAFQSAPRDTIRLDLARSPLLEPQRSMPTAPPNGTPVIPAPPLVPTVPHQTLTLEPPRFAGPPLDVMALSGIRPAPDSGRPADGLGPAPAVLTMTEVDVLPQPIGGLVPYYPEALRRTGVSGQVLLEYVIGSSGWVDSSSVQVLRSSHPAFSDAAREALRGMHFRPARRSGRPVMVLVRQAIRFEIR